MSMAVRGVKPGATVLGEAISRLHKPPLMTSFRAPRASAQPRRGAGVVERGGLENRCTLAGTVGSNPTLSATYFHQHIVFIDY